MADQIRVSQEFSEVTSVGADSSRVSQLFAEAVGVGETYRVSQMFAESIFLLITPPTTPTITVDAYDQISVALRSSAFVAGEGGTHQASQWQITTAGDTGFASPVHDSGTTTVYKTVYSYSGLDGGTPYIARVRHQEDNDVWSAWATAASFTTTSLPDKPTISIAGTAADYAAFDGSAFNSSDPAVTHAATQWQLAASGDTGFASPLDDVTVYTGDLESWTFFGLDLWANQYIARVRYRDSNGGWSPWSDPSSATSLVTVGQFYTAMAERPVGTDIVDDALADWDEYEDGDTSDWPITVRDDATCQVVSDRDPSAAADADTVDPIRSNALPDVDKQIVWAKVIFDYAGSAGDCPPGSVDSAPNGTICKTRDGHLESYCLGDVADWALGPEGAGEEWQFLPTGGPNGCGSIRYFRKPLQKSNTWAYFDGAGSQPAGRYAQFRHRRYFWDGVNCLERFPYLQGGAWPGILFALNGARHGYLFDNPFVSWFYWFKHLLRTFTDGNVSTLTDQGGLQFAVGTCGWDYMRVGWDSGYQWYNSSAASGAGASFYAHEWNDNSYSAGGLGIYLNSVPDERVDVFEDTYLEWADLEICDRNYVRVWNIKPWHQVRIDFDGFTAIGASSYFENGFMNSYRGTSGSEAIFQFSADAWPAQEITLYDTRTWPSWTLLDSWRVDGGIWGGDEFYINDGGLGVGNIGGAAVRLNP